MFSSREEKIANIEKVEVECYEDGTPCDLKSKDVDTFLDWKWICPTCGKLWDTAELAASCCDDDLPGDKEYDKEYML